MLRGDRDRFDHTTLDLLVLDPAGKPARALLQTSLPSFGMVRIPTISAGHSELMSATVSDPSRPAVPIDVGRVAHRPLGWVDVSMVVG